MKKLIIKVAIGMLLGILTQTQGAFIYDDYEQARSVAADSSEKESNDTGLFSDSVTDSFFNINSTYSKNEYRSSAGQRSYLTDNMISFSGSASNSDPFYHVNLNSITLDSGSYLRSVFRVDNSCQVELSGLMQAWADYGGTTGYSSFSTYIRLSDGNGTDIFSMTMPFLPSSGDYDFPITPIMTLELASDTFYTLSLAASIQSRYYSSNVPEYGGGGGTSLNFTMSIVPEPATLCLLGLGGLILRRKNLNFKSDK